MQPQEGKIHFRMLEPMEELDYLDQTRLIAVDHPVDVEVYPNERFASERPFPKFKVIASREAHLPVGVWDEHSHDLLPLLREARSQICDRFPARALRRIRGMHWIELDLGDWDRFEPAAPAARWLHRLFQRQFDVRRMAGGNHSGAAVCRSAR